MDWMTQALGRQEKVPDPFSAPYHYKGPETFNPKVRIPLTGKYDSDFAAADAMAGIKDPNWRRNNGYTWHHSQKLGTMELVPTDLNDNFGHAGGAAIYIQLHGSGYGRTI